MDLPEAEQLLDAVKTEWRVELYNVLDEETQRRILETEKLISENQQDTGVLFSKMDGIQRLLLKLQQQALLSGVAEKKAGVKRLIKDKVGVDTLRRMQEEKAVELGALEHQISVVLLSKPELGQRIEALKAEVVQAGKDFEGTQEEAKLSDLLYTGINIKILQMIILLAGNELTDTIDTMIENNQQVTLELNEANRDTAKGVQIEEQLEAIASSAEDRQEQNGFLTDEDVTELQG